MSPALQNITAKQELHEIKTDLHIADGNIHTQLDDGNTSYSTLWSSSKTASEITVFDQNLNEGANVQFGSVQVTNLSIGQENAYTLPTVVGQTGTVLTVSGDNQCEWVTIPTTDEYILPADLNVSTLTATGAIAGSALIVNGDAGYVLPPSRGTTNQVLTQNDDGYVRFEDVQDISIKYPYSFPASVPPEDNKMYTLTTTTGAQGGYHITTVGLDSNLITFSYINWENQYVEADWFAPADWSGNPVDFAVLVEEGVQGLIVDLDPNLTVGFNANGRFYSSLRLRGFQTRHRWMRKGQLFDRMYWDGPQAISTGHTSLKLPEIPTSPTNLNWTEPKLPGQFVYFLKANEARYVSDTTGEGVLVQTNSGIGYLGIRVNDLYPGYTFSMSVEGDIVTDAPPGGLVFRLRDAHHSHNVDPIASHIVPIIRDITSIDTAVALANKISLTAATAAHTTASNLADTARDLMETDVIALQDAIDEFGNDSSQATAATAALLASTTALTAAVTVMVTTAETVAIVTSNAGVPQINTYRWDLTCTWTAEGRLRVSHRFQYGWAYDNSAVSFSTSDSLILEKNTDISFQITAQWSDAKVNNIVNLRNIIQTRIM
jgi:hypothetical protein